MKTRSRIAARMIGIDTNVLVRFLIEDDPAQTNRVHQLLGKIQDEG